MTSSTRRGGRPPCLSIQPANALVQLGADLLRRAAVGGLLDQDVVEAEGVLAREGRALGADQVLAHEGLQVASDAAGGPPRARAPRPRPTRTPCRPPRRTGSPRAPPRESRSRRAPRRAWIDAGTATSPRSPVADPAPSSRRRRPSSSSIRSISSRKSGLPPADSAIRAVRPLVEPRRHRAGPRRAPRSRRRRAGASGSERAFGDAASPRWPDVQQVRAGEAQEQQRDVAAPAREVLDEVQERGLGPLEVVEEHHERPVAPRATRGTAGSPRTSPAARPSTSANPVTAATRSAIERRVLAPAERGVDLRARLLPRVVVVIAHACFTSSATGQNVMPSP